MTYAELLADLASWVQRDDMTSVLPRCVTYATAALNRELDRSPVPEMESRDTSSLTAEYKTLPSDFLRMRSVTRSDGKEILYITPAAMNELAASGSEPDPQVYTLVDMQLRVWPAPSVSEPVTVVLAYIERISDLVSGSDTNWMLTSYPDIYFLASLMQARMWLHDDPRMAQMQAMYDAAMRQTKGRALTAPGLPVALKTDIQLMTGAFDITTGL